MSDKFDKPTLTRIIGSSYPNEAKVAQIISLYEQHRIHQLNEISNEIGHVIDTAKEDD